DLVIKAVDNGLSLLDEQMRAPEKYKPDYYSEEEWNQEMETGLRSMLLRLKGNALLKQGQAAEATSYLKQAYEINQGEQPAIGVDYARVLLANNNFQVAQEVLEAIAGKGFTNSELINLLKQAYTGSSGSEAGWENYKNRIEARATEFLCSQLEKRMVEQPAAAFELKDLEGKTVKLANYKGNVVILDFWATWCGPCLSSFPGMKSLVEEFQSDPSVAFIFVNTWQEEENKVQVVKDFLEKNQYPFYVLIDSEDKVVADYGVSGIPTKFIIDPKGKIRFKSIGFEGDTDKMVKEIKLMIELARSK
ncbi:MAG: redoxin domain-containing protein, partial [Acidobacteriota bacterium]|nr:redoxin domain-containing protein [Acidobacteriota bacterium]